MILDKSENIIRRSHYANKENKIDDIIKFCVSDIEGKFRFRNNALLYKEAETVKDTILNIEPVLYDGMSKMRKYHEWIFKHSVNVALLSTLISSLFYYEEHKKEILCTGALLHDIGKLYVPEAILDKPGCLNKNEMETMRSHCMLGYNSVQGIDLYSESKLIILQHHERLDGSGYPFGLRNDCISDKVRIVMVADALDAITSRRPYRKPQTAKEAFEIISNDNARYPADIAALIREMIY